MFRMTTVEITYFIVVLIVVLYIYIYPKWKRREQDIIREKILKLLPISKKDFNIYKKDSIRNSFELGDMLPYEVYDDYIRDVKLPEEQKKVIISKMEKSRKERDGLFIKHISGLK